MSRIDLMNLGTLAKKIKSRELKCVAVATKYVENIEKNSSLNAFIYFDKKSVLDKAKRLDNDLDIGKNRGRLHGVPILIKDNIHVKNQPNTVGCPGLKNFIPKFDSRVVEILREEGALFLGKSNLDELFIDYNGNNKYYGRIRNPHNPDYISGGSSGGIGCAIASCQAPAGIGSDTNGSIRVPSSMTGIFGLRPTVGRYPKAGMTPMSSTCDTIGPMGKYIEDLSLLDEIITGEAFNSGQMRENQIRIGIPKPKSYLCNDLDQEVEASFENVKKLLSRQNIKLVEVDLQNIERLANKLTMLISTYEGAGEFKKYLEEYKIGLTFKQLVGTIETPEIKTKFEKFMVDGAPNSVKREKYEECINVRRPKLLAEYKKLFGDNDINVFMYPSIVCLPVRFDQIKGAETMWSIAKNCIATSNACIPSLTMPMGKSKNSLPIGLQLETLWNQDQLLLQIGEKVNHILEK